VTYLKVGEINTLKEQFEADILVRLKWREPELDNVPLEKAETINWAKMWNPKVFIDNAVGEPKYTGSELLMKSPEGHAYVIERKRYRGTFMEQMELWEFPFDVQDLSIMVMSDLDATELDLVEDPDEIHKIQRQSFIDEQEWYLYKWIEGTKMELAPDRADPSIRRPAINIKARAGRRPAYFVWNIFSVTFMIACLCFITFSVHPSLVANRLQLTFIVMLTSVAFRFTVHQSLPRVSYLTYLDRYIIATMITLASVCLWHGLTSLMDPDNRNRDYIALAVFVALYILYNMQFFMRIYVIPYRRRREMKVKEREYVEFVAKQVEEREFNKRKSKRMSKLQESDVGEDVPLTKVTTG